MSQKINTKKIVLASASPRRKELLEKLGFEFTVEASNSDEAVRPGVEPHELAESLSREKASMVGRNHRNALVIAADTFILLDDMVLGKPASETEARDMLQRITGRQHSVITGFTILDTASNKAISESVETRVYMRKLTLKEIDAYVKTGEPLDKAGAYAIQGLGSVIVERIEGDYFNVIGLPLSALTESLKEFGIYVL